MYSHCASFNPCPTAEAMIPHRKTYCLPQSPRKLTETTQRSSPSLFLRTWTTSIQIEIQKRDCQRSSSTKKFKFSSPGSRSRWSHSSPSLTGHSSKILTCVECTPMQYTITCWGKNAQHWRTAFTWRPSKLTSLRAWEPFSLTGLLMYTSSSSCLRKLSFSLSIWSTDFSHWDRSPEQNCNLLEWQL